MATITLAGNTNVSALTLANGDTINLAGFQLTFDAQPTASGISVVSPGTAGSCVFSVATVIPTWNFTAGTRTPNMISTLPANCEIGNVTGGSVFNAFCIDSNLGRISGNVTAGNANSARGVNTNNGTIAGNVTAGNAAAAYAIATNSREILGNVTGGPANVAIAIQDNRGTIRGTVTGGTGTNAAGISVNFGIIFGNCKAGTNSAAHAIAGNVGSCIGGLENTGAIAAIGAFTGSSMIIDGPNTKISIPAQITRVYSLFGPINPLAIIPVTTEVIELTEGGGGFPLSRVLN